MLDGVRGRLGDREDDPALDVLVHLLVLEPATEVRAEACELGRGGAKRTAEHGRRRDAMNRQNANIVVLALRVDQGIADLVCEGGSTEGAAAWQRPRADRGRRRCPPTDARPGRPCRGRGSRPLQGAPPPRPAHRRASSRAAPSGPPTGTVSARRARRRVEADDLRTRSGRPPTRSRARRTRASQSGPRGRSRRTRRGDPAATAGPDVCARALTAPRSCPIATAASSPWPTTSPTTSATDPERRGKASYQSPPTSRAAVPARYAGVTTIFSKAGSAPPRRPSCRVWDTSRSRS